MHAACHPAAGRAWSLMRSICALRSSADAAWEGSEVGSRVAVRKPGHERDACGSAAADSWTAAQMGPPTCLLGVVVGEEPAWWGRGRRGGIGSVSRRRQAAAVARAASCSAALLRPGGTPDMPAAPHDTLGAPWGSADLRRRAAQLEAFYIAGAVSARSHCPPAISERLQVNDCKCRPCRPPPHGRRRVASREILPARQTLQSRAPVDIALAPQARIRLPAARPSLTRLPLADMLASSAVAARAGTRLVPSGHAARRQRCVAAPAAKAAGAGRHRLPPPAPSPPPAAPDLSPSPASPCPAPHPTQARRRSQRGATPPASPRCASPSPRPPTWTR